MSCTGLIWESLHEGAIVYAKTRHQEIRTSAKDAAETGQSHSAKENRNESQVRNLPDRGSVNHASEREVRPENRCKVGHSLQAQGFSLLACLPMPGDFKGVSGIRSNTFFIHLATENIRLMNTY